MGLESGTFVDDLVTTNPVGAVDDVNQGDNHLRLVKTVLKNTFPNATRAFRFEAVLTKVAAYPVVAADARALILADVSGGAFTVTLPLGSSVFAGFTVIVMKSDSGGNAVTVDGNGAETINGAVTRSLSVQYQAEKYTWDGTEWKLLAVTRVGTGELLDDAVTLIKIQNIATARVLGRTTAGSGIVEELTAAQATALLNTLTSALKGLAPASGGGTVNFLRADGTWVIPPDNFSTALLHVRDEKASGTDGGAFNSGSFQTRDLNTVATNQISGASLSANQITLPAGDYIVRARTPAKGVGNHKALLRNISDASNTLIGSSARNTLDSLMSDSVVVGRFTIAASKIFELQHRCVTTRVIDGFGQASVFSVVEVYAEIEIWKVG